MGLEVFRSFGRCLCFCWARFQTGIPPHGGVVAAVTIVRVAPPRHHQEVKLDRRSRLWGGGPTSILLATPFTWLAVARALGSQGLVLEPFALASRGGVAGSPRHRLYIKCGPLLWHGSGLGLWYVTHVVFPRSSTLAIDDVLYRSLGRRSLAQQLRRCSRTCPAGFRVRLLPKLAV